MSKLCELLPGYQADTLSDGDLINFLDHLDECQPCELAFREGIDRENGKEQAKPAAEPPPPPPSSDEPPPVPAEDNLHQFRPPEESWTLEDIRRAALALEDERRSIA